MAEADDRRGVNRHLSNNKSNKNDIASVPLVKEMQRDTCSDCYDGTGRLRHAECMLLLPLTYEAVRWYKLSTNTSIAIITKEDSAMFSCMEYLVSALHDVHRDHCYAGLFRARHE